MRRRSKVMVDIVECLAVDVRFEDLEAVLLERWMMI